MSTPKRHAMEGDDTRQVVMKNWRDSSSSPPPSEDASPSSSPGYESPPSAVPLPWERDDDDGDDEFQLSPASPPLTQTTEREERSPPTIYVLPDASIVLSADGVVRIPDRPANPEPSTSQRDNSETDPEVCDIMIEEAVSNLIAYNWRRSGRTLDEATTNTCQDITATIMSSEWQEQVKEYVRAYSCRP